MPDHPADTQPDLRGGDASQGTTDVTLQFGEAAIGPVNTAHYLAAFARLNAVGRAVPLWNWAAALFPPGWMAFRSLWRWLLASLAVVGVLAALLVFAQRAVALPAPVLAGVALALWLGYAAASGLWGDALVHRRAQQRIQAAVAGAPTMQEALKRLRSEAPTRRRVLAIAVACLMVLAFAVAWGWGAGGGSPAPRAESAVRPIGVGPADIVRAPQPVPAFVPEDDAARAVSVQAATDEALAALAVREPPAKSAPAREAKRAPDAGKHQGKAEAPAARRLYVNVGLFADPANAQRVHERLTGHGLPSAVDTLTRPSGTVLRRVRVGPFTSAAQANEAAAKVRALGLEAAPAADVGNGKDSDA